MASCNCFLQWVHCHTPVRTSHGGFLYTSWGYPRTHHARKMDDQTIVVETYGDLGIHRSTFLRLWFTFLSVFFHEKFVGGVHYSPHPEANYWCVSRREWSLLGGWLPTLSWRSWNHPFPTWVNAPVNHLETQWHQQTPWFDCWIRQIPSLQIPNADAKKNRRVRLIRRDNHPDTT